MRRIQKILFGTFLGGVLLCGVGAGTALVEYSSFTYAGEKKIGWEDLETKNLDFSFDRQKGSLIVDTGFWGRRVSDGIEADPAVPEGIIRYEVTYNKKRVEPFLEFYEFLEGPGAEDPGGDGGQTKEKTAGEPQGHLELMASSRGGDLEIFMECKDEFLKEVKEKRKCLKLDPPGILSGKMFYAREAVAVGLIDEIGTLGRAVEVAKELEEMNLINKYINS